MTPEEPPPVEPWTAYWRTGRAASCFNHRDVEVTLTRVWQEFVDELGNNARLLDLATGNGTVARSCAARARERERVLRITAVDAAEIDPAGTVVDPQQLLPQVNFQGRVRLEALPFPDAAFDGVVSQFGFEYAEEAQATAEAARVLAPGGVLRLIMHAHEGAVSRDIRLRLERLHSVLSSDGPVTLVHNLAHAAAVGDQEAVEQLSQKLPAAVSITRRLSVRPPPEDAALFYASEFLKLWEQRGRYWPKDLYRSVLDGWTNATGVALRQQQMLQAARTAEDVRRIEERFRSFGLLVERADDINDMERGVRIAWALSAHKPKPSSA